ncbi:MAG: hypothetical protein P8124_14065 [Gammaproteobacteria bacterium]
MSLIDDLLGAAQALFEDRETLAAARGDRRARARHYALLASVATAELAAALRLGEPALDQCVELGAALAPLSDMAASPALVQLSTGLKADGAAAGLRAEVQALDGRDRALADLDQAAGVLRALARTMSAGQ